MKSIRGGLHPELPPEEMKEAMEYFKVEDKPDTRPIVLHVALEAPTYSSHGIREGFRRAGYYVEFFNWQVLKMEFGVQGMIDRLVAKATACQPDLIFMHIQNEGILDAMDCDMLREIGYTVLYTFDCRDKEKSQWMYDLAPHLDYVFFSNMEDVSNCLELGIENTGIMASSCDIDLYKPKEVTVFKIEPISFIGGDYSKSNMNFPKAIERKEMCEYLMAEFGVKFKSHGMGQIDSRYIHQNEEAGIYNLTEISIAQNNFDRPFYTSDRIWRIMSSGCFCLTEYFEGIETMFEIGKHLDVWVSLEDLKEKINYYLHFAEERKAIAKCGSLYVRENHSWQNRFEVFSEMIKTKKK